MAFVLLLALTGSIGVVAAQDSTTIALTIEASPPWIEQVPQDVVPDMTPGQLLSDGERMVLVLADTFDDAAQLRLDSLEELGAAPASIGTLDQGRGGALAYWLDVANVDGQPWGAFTLVRSDASGAQVFTMFFGPVDGFAVGMASAQDAVTVNGGPIFDGVGGQGLQDLLESAGPAPSSPEAVDEGSGDKLRGARKATSPDGTWTDPIYGFDVTWEGDWTDSTRDENTFMLESGDGSVFLHLTGQSAAGMNTGALSVAMAGALKEAEERLDVTFDPAGIHVDDDNVILAGHLDGMPFIQEGILIDGGDIVVIITLGIDPDSDLEQSVELYRESILIGGVAPLDGWETIEM